MSDESRPYIVKQGDHLARVAQRMGFDAEKIWRLPDNEKVTNAHPSPAVLYPGDIVTIPAESERKKFPLKAKTTNKVTGKAMVEINLKFEEGGKPLKNEPFVVEGMGLPVEGASDGDGKVTFKAPVYVREVYLCFPNKDRKYPVKIGHMDPIEEDSGVYARLHHLGYVGGVAGDKVGGTMNYHLALFRFQIDNGILPTGMADELTRAKLVEVHGC